jgi:uncharacterized protein (DUF2225 family)
VDVGEKIHPVNLFDDFLDQNEQKDHEEVIVKFFYDHEEVSVTQDEVKAISNPFGSYPEGIENESLFYLDLVVETEIGHEEESEKESET